MLLPSLHQPHCCEPYLLLAPESIMVETRRRAKERSSFLVTPFYHSSGWGNPLAGGRSPASLFTNNRAGVRGTTSSLIATDWRVWRACSSPLHPCRSTVGDDGHEDQPSTSAARISDAQRYTIAARGMIAWPSSRLKWSCLIDHVIQTQHGTVANMQVSKNLRIAV